MKFGVVLPTYPAGATIEGFVRVAKAADRLGFDSVWTTDHVVLPPDQAGPYAEIFEPLLTLAYLAPLTERVRLGVSVIVAPQRNGVILAKELATLDRLSGGRLIVGVGAGWSEDEFRMLDAGARFRRRGAHLDETLRLWRHLWSAPRTPFHGTFYDLPPVAFGPGPVRPDGPPIWVGGSSDAARRRAGQSGDGWHPVGIGVDELAAQATLVEATAAAAGRAAPLIAPRLPIEFGSGGEALAVGRMRTIAGSPNEVRTQLTEYRQAGANEVVCLFNSPDGSVVVERMETFAREVMPAFANP
jgi:probable F420-dependent oxidoreductase